MHAVFAQYARLPVQAEARSLAQQRWARDVRLSIDARGDLVQVQEGATPQAGDARLGIVLPGMIDLHSHAFQRAMAGLPEIASAHEDDFWSWRDWMYRFLSRLTPDDLQAIAAQLYVEKLKSGVTSLVEFHYVHRDPQGRAYANLAEMGERVWQAGRDAGIGLTLAPVLYSHGGFGGLPLQAGQRRFASEVDELLRMLQQLARQVDADAALALAPHSLRAVRAEQIRALVAGAPPDCPLHIHAAEQVKEVEQSLAALGKRPVQHLLEDIGLDARWCVVHATHLTDAERRGLAASGAVAGLCPSTEADLGDGVFPFTAYAREAGRWGIGGDAQVCRAPFEELRLIETVQRLYARRRNVSVPGLDGAATVAVGDWLWDQAVAGGAQACGRKVGRLAPGARADLIEVQLLDAGADLYPIEAWLNQAIFSGASVQVKAAMVGGQWRVREGHHPEEERIAARYRGTLARLLA